MNMQRCYQKLRDDNQAVSPVIGVILMVAITVILAAVIASFVLGLGENLNDNAPSITFNCESGNAVVQGGQTNFDGTVTDSVGTTYSSLSPGDTLSGGRVTWTNAEGTQTATLFEGCS